VTALGALAYFAVSSLLSLFFLALVWLSDRYEREPPWLVLLAAVWGAVPAILLSCLTEVLVSLPFSMALGTGPAEVIGTVLVAPAVEEVAKGMAILFVVVLYRREFDDVLDGMVYGAAVGIGFSFVEDAMYFVGALGQSGLGGGAWTFAFRNVAFVLNHSLFSAVTGIGFGIARAFHKDLAARIGWPLLGLAVAIGLHATHNALAQFAMPGFVLALLLHWAGGLGLLALVPFLWGAERAWIVSRLKVEVGDGLIPPEALGALPFSGVKAMRALGFAERSATRRDLVELAFHRRSAEEGWAIEAGRDLEELRGRIRDRFPQSAPPPKEAT
jgi:protease PrsW